MVRPPPNTGSSVLRVLIEDWDSLKVSQGHLNKIMERVRGDGEKKEKAPGAEQLLNRSGHNAGKGVIC